MKFQHKVIETTADLRTRAVAFASIALETARARAALAAKRVDGLKTSLTALQAAGREFNKMARRHVTRFVEENSVIALDASKDVTALARSTYSTLARRGATSGRKARKTAVTRKGPRARPGSKASAA